MNLSTTLPPTRSRRRHSGLGAIGAGILAVSLMALAGAAAPAAAADCSTNAPLNECIPGGATSRLKTVEVRGDAAALAALLQERLLQERLAAAGRKT